LGAASILDRETHPRAGIHFANELQFNVQGTDNMDYTDADLCGVRILGVQPNRGDSNSVARDLHNIAGERVVILGEFPVRTRDARGAVRMDPSGNPDTSFLVRFPADIPYLMQGIDCEGRTLNTDQTWQSLRPGETKTCGGCHVHSAAATKLPYDTSFAAKDPTNNTAILGNGKIPLLAGGSGAGVQKREVDGYGYMIEF